ncbi:methyl-accepting chemotaxis protein [Massilia sp. LjRoot122]|uniref:methyl-accepting chemotaxis protein n=1 Tax=Massilia sp. LjRoot122 TaxID=3342257 RepID=UPI003F4FD6FE
MNKKSLTIGMRLTAGYGAVFFLMIVLTALAISRVGDIGRVLNHINDVNNVKQRYAINFRGSVHDRAIALRDVVLTADPAGAAAPVSLIKTLDDNYARSAQPMDKLFQDLDGILPAEKDALAAIKEQERRAKPLIERVIALHAAGQGQEAAALLSQAAAPAFVDWLASINTFIDLQEKLNNEQAAGARAMASGFLGWMTLLCLGAIAVGAAGAWYIARGLLRQLGGQPDYAASIVAAIAAGDLGVKIDTAPGDRGSLLFAMKGMRDSLVAIVGQVRKGTMSIASVSTELADGNRDLSSRTERQASTLEATAASVEQLTATVRQNADNARQANALAESASAVAVRGGSVVSQVVETMASINDSSKKIVDIIGVIDGIAFQTNILALNAAVEAARAGEQGRGFAVVASEVRNLAQRSAAAAKEIKGLIGSSVERVEAGARQVDEAGATMKDIVHSVRRVTDIMAEITHASGEQSAGIGQVNEAIGQMDEATRQNATLVQEATTAAASLEAEAERLARVVSVFRLDEARDGAPPRPAQLAIAGH